MQALRGRTYLLLLSFPVSVVAGALTARFVSGLVGDPWHRALVYGALGLPIGAVTLLLSRWVARRFHVPPAALSTRIRDLVGGLLLGILLALTAGALLRWSAPSLVAEPRPLVLEGHWSTLVLLVLVTLAVFVVVRTDTAKHPSRSAAA